MTRFAAIIVGLLALASASDANSPDPKGLSIPPDQVARAHQLVRQLGSEAYRDRDRAARELRGMGRLAVTALAGAATAETDPEVRARCEGLLPAAEADDMAARAAAFLADVDGKYDHDIPGWAEFQAATGTDEQARALFASIVKNPDNHPLLRAIRRPTDRLPGAVVARRQRLQITLTATAQLPHHVDRVITPPNTADVAALLLAESLIPERSVPPYRLGSTEYQVTAFLHIAKGREAVAADPAFRRLVMNWLETRNGPTGPIQAINLAEQLGLGTDAVNRLAARAITTDGLTAIHKDTALRKLVRNNGKDYLPAVTKLFNDDGLLVKGFPGTPSPDDLLLRDVALLAAVRLTGQSPADYGFTTGPAPGVQRIFVAPMFPQNRAGMELDSPMSQQFRTSGSTTAQMKRTEAFKKWDEWAGKNLPPQ